ncbi:MAG: sigma-54-dependent Fis family transcriptional regulator [Desulfamplus sp.]|nr:sigma-54-dependent Fis family transcriptional regulator [Desulfamplus sp.]
MKQNNRLHILVVDSNYDILNFLKDKLTSAGYDTLTAQGVESALAVLDFKTVDIVITALKMPKGQADGLDLLRYIKDNFTTVEVIMITEYPEIDTAVQCIKEGAQEYIAKPFRETDILHAVDGVKQKIVRRRIASPKEKPVQFLGIIGVSPKMEEVFERIDRAAQTNANVLISGESGTGKELVARAIHYGSYRAESPFVSVNCTAIPDSLLESELFGHVKGAFTDAKRSRQGFFQIAEKGTLFLDEIGDASLGMQAKLLRVIQNKEINMVGSSQMLKIDTRIIAASHKDLKSMIPKGLFREDLYYRLDVINIAIPPLRERREDILPLVSFYLKKFSEEMELEKPPTFTDNALQALKNNDWQGNVRELENLIQRLVVIVEAEQIGVSDLPQSMRFNVNSKNSSQFKTLKEVEEEHLSLVLAGVGGNKTKAAQILGIDRKTLRQKIASSKFHISLDKK